MRKANIMQFLYGSLILSTKQFFLSFYCHEGSLTVHDIDVLLHSSLALLKAIFALMMVDAEIFKQLSSSQKVRTLCSLSSLLCPHLFVLFVCSGHDYVCLGVLSVSLAYFAVGFDQTRRLWQGRYYRQGIAANARGAYRRCLASKQTVDGIYFTAVAISFDLNQ